MADREDGFTIVEVLIAIFIFSIVSVGFYQVLFSATRGSNTTRDVVRVSEEARLGFNRMVRDTREGNILNTPSSTSYTVDVDFDGDGSINLAAPTDPTGNYESLTFTFNPSSGGEGNITVSTPWGASEVLVDGVDCIRKPDNSCHDVFTFSSSRLEYDTMVVDGVTSAAEIDAAPGVGNGSGAIDTLPEIRLIDGVAIALVVRQGDSSTSFYAHAQLRNRR